MRLRVAEELHGGDHSLPQRQQIVNAVRRELPHLQRLHGERGDERNRFGVDIDVDEFNELEIGLETGEQATELVEVAGIAETGRIVENVLDALDEMAEEFLALDVREQGASHGGDLNEGGQGEAGELSGQNVVEVEEQFGCVHVEEGGTPIGGDLNQTWGVRKER